MNFDFTSFFTLPTKVYCGYNSVDLAGGEAKKIGIRKALLVTDKGVSAAGVTKPLLRSLESAGIPYEIFDDVPMDPNTQIVNKGCESLTESGCDGVITIGGGSALCAGKGIALVATNAGNVRDYEGRERYKSPPLPVVAIPTTAGSGTEVSSVFIITDETRNDYKMAIGGYSCFPKVAILDPLLLRTLPPRQFIISGVDALAHAIEATCTNQSSPLTDAIAYESIRLIIENLPVAACTDDLDAKREQLLASAMTNMACDNANLGLAHATGQPLGSYHIPHGLSVGIMLPYVMEYNLPACEDKLARMAEVIRVVKEGMSLREKATAAIDAVKELYIKVDFPDRLTEDMAPKARIPDMVPIAMGRPQVKANLRKAGEKDLAQIYQRAYEGWR